MGGGASGRGGSRIGSWPGMGGFSGGLPGPGGRSGIWRARISTTLPFILRTQQDGRLRDNEVSLLRTI
jgi:hypothetical protein